MEKKLSYLTLAATLFLSPPLLALTDAEIEARLDQDAAKIKALEAELANAKKSPVYEQDVGKSSDSKLAKQIQQIKDKMDNEEKNFKINGFLTAGVNMADDNVGGDFAIDNKPTIGGDSKMGLQVSAKINDKADATVQLLARGRGKGLGNSSDPWQVSAEWAYLGYQVTDDVKVRMGRLRIPFYMTSETLDVGYSYPWVRPPMEMYTTALTSYNGLDVLYKFSVGSVNTTAQLFTGSSANMNNMGDADQELSTSLEDLYGLNLTAAIGNWTVRAMASTLSIDGESAVRTDTILPDVGVDISALYSLPPGSIYTPALDQYAAYNLAALSQNGLNFDSCDLDQITGAYCLGGGYLHSSADDRFDYYSLGAQYDNGSLFVMSEVAKLKTKRARIFSDTVAMYVTTGYRIDSWTPYITYAHTYDTESAAYLAANNLNPSIKPDASKSRSIGLRKELGSSMDVKVEWNNRYDFEVPSATYGDDLNIYTITLDAVF